MNILILPIYEWVCIECATGGHGRCHYAECSCPRCNEDCDYFGETVETTFKGEGLMDPNAVLRLISEALDANNDEADNEAEDAANDLARWLDRGGYEPDWSAYPEASEWFKTRD